MDHRWYFALGDLLANLFCGALIGAAVWLATPPGWNMWLAMAVAMCLGMVLAALLWLPASIWLGAMEVMVPLMLTGMVAGMVVGMHSAMVAISGSSAVLEGALCGLLTIVGVWIANLCLRGPRSSQGGRRDRA